MLKSPSSILNSIQRMKTNLRNDKEQLRIIKTNFVYLDHIQPRARPFDHETKTKNRSKSVLNPSDKQLGVEQNAHYEKQSQDKENDNSRANYIPKQVDSRITAKDQASTQRESIVKTNRVYLSKEDYTTDSQNILNAHQNFKKSQSSRVHQEKSKDSAQIKALKARYQTEIQKLKQTHEEEKRQLVSKIMSSAKSERDSYERQIKEMREYIQLLETQLQEINSQHRYSSEHVNTSCQMTQPISLPISMNNTAQQFTQTPEFTNGTIHPNNLQTTETNFMNTKPNQFINGICIHENNLIEELCLKYFGDGNNDRVVESSSSLVRGSCEEEGFEGSERKKYEHIINKLLEENTKLYNKMQKIYGQAHSSQNTHNNHNSHQSNKQIFFKSFGINYKTVTSQGVQESQDHSSVTSQSRVIQKYPSSKQSPSIPIQSAESGSEFASRVTDSQNYNSHREASIESKGKQSIVYRISNVMSASVNKEGKSSSRSKIPCKNPPVKVKQGINVSMPQNNQRRMKTEISERCSEFYSQNYGSNVISNFDTVGGSSSHEVISSEERIPTMREKMKNEPSFKFYDSESQSSNKYKKEISKPTMGQRVHEGWQDESESEIKDDEIKLKTIKNFRCMQNQ